ncbi:hypothetical protein C492_07630 [Natronococcus jeotgali DSM 18795]|uniref:Uncharacterized protein n=1 Tax=Natronococcus jeotgali DSM 18795 TaxID=1227498 RepID=L9XPR8_9EURY|nr:hypothetical protein C492_07630 [Natronococcus jeotgali DSM 18795]
MVPHLAFNPGLAVAIRINGQFRLIRHAVCWTDARWQIVKHQFSPPLTVCAVFSNCNPISEILHPSQKEYQHY